MSAERVVSAGGYELWPNPDPKNPGFQDICVPPGMSVEEWQRRGGRANDPDWTPELVAWSAWQFDPRPLSVKGPEPESPFR